MFSETFFDARTENDLRDLAARPAIRPACVARPVAGRRDAVGRFEEDGKDASRSVWNGVPGALFGLVTWALVAAALFLTVPPLVQHVSGEATQMGIAPLL
jgi:hypothetical protein